MSTEYGDILSVSFVGAISPGYFDELFLPWSILSPGYFVGAILKGLFCPRLFCGSVAVMALLHNIGH